MTGSAHFFGQRIKAYIGDIRNPIGVIPGEFEPHPGHNFFCTFLSVVSTSNKLKVSSHSSNLFAKKNQNVSSPLCGSDNGTIAQATERPLGSEV